MTPWRDVLPVHPAADVFPLLSRDELRQLAADIDENGLHESVALWVNPQTNREELLDGRNRLDALERLGHEIFDKKGRVHGRTIEWVDPVAYVIARNIRRRHLTKRQQADLIVAAVKAGATDRAKPARSVTRDRVSGQVNGTTKDPIKEQVVTIAAEQGISERTARQALVEAEPERRRPRPTRRAAASTMTPQTFAVSKLHQVCRYWEELDDEEYVPAPEIARRIRVIDHAVTVLTRERAALVSRAKE